MDTALVGPADITLLEKNGQYRVVVLYYYYSAIANTKQTIQLDQIQKSITVLKKYCSLKNSEDKAILGLLYIYYSQFFTGITRSYYISMGVLLLNQNVQLQPNNLRLRFLRLLSFTNLPPRFYDVKKYLNVDKSVLLASIAQSGLQEVNTKLDYLYYKHWENMLQDIQNE